MGASSVKLPEDQYVCSYCGSIPQIIDLNFMEGKIKFNCDKHGTINITIKDYFEKESKYLYYNIKCHLDNTPQNNKLPYIFNHIIKEGKNLCESCSENQENRNLTKIKVNEINSICKIHLKNYTKFCKECKKHFCSEDTIDCRHIIEDIKNLGEKEKKKIKNKIEQLSNLQINIGYFNKFLETMLESYEKHPSNFYHSSNISNLFENKIIKNEELNYISKEKKIDYQLHK